MMELVNTGERQTSPTLEGIKPDHRGRYLWVSEYISTGSIVLDAACGNGYGSYILANNGLHFVTSIDIEQSAIDFAANYYSHPDIHQICADLNTFNYDEIYDYVISFETIEHLQDPRPFLCNLVTTSHKLILSVPNENVQPFNSSNFPFHFRHYTPEELESLMSATGWKITNWFTQYNKFEEKVDSGKDGRILIVEAEPIKK